MTLHANAHSGLLTCALDWPPHWQGLGRGQEGMGMTEEEAFPSEVPVQDIAAREASSVPPQGLRTGYSLHRKQFFSSKHTSPSLFPFSSVLSYQLFEKAFADNSL